jgi:hypothetical protein
LVVRRPLRLPLSPFVGVLDKIPVAIGVMEVVERWPEGRGFEAVVVYVERGVEGEVELPPDVVVGDEVQPLGFGDDIER